MPRARHNRLADRNEREQELADEFADSDGEVQQHELVALYKQIDAPHKNELNDKFGIGSPSPGKLSFAEQYGQSFDHEVV